MSVEEDRPNLGLEEFRLLAELVYDHCGIRFRPDHRFLLERRLAPRLRALGLRDFTAYRQRLRFGEGHRAELEAAIEVLTTHETYFFREPNQLRAFTRDVLPALHERRAQERRLRLWSAGCSTGEEAYTIAMLLLEDERFAGWDLEVFGSDLSRKVIGTARRGEYAPGALRSTEPGRRERFFEERPGGRVAVTEEVRRLVSFGHLNLLDADLLGLVGKVDVIFCRNVLIYFDVEARKRVVKSLFEKLFPGGWLLLGHAESLLNVTTDFELVHLVDDLVYRRPGGRA